MSNNLSLSQVTASQNQKEVTINAQAAELDAAITVKADFTIDNTNARTLTSTELRRNFLFHLINAGSPPTADITLTVPAISRGVFAILNATAYPVTVTISGQPVTAPVIAAGATTPSLLTVDGVNVRLASSAGAGGGGGTTDFSKVSAGHAVASLATTGFDLADYFNRGLLYRLEIEETARNSTGTYDVRLYAKDTKLAADLLYSVDAIDSTANGRIYTDQLPIYYRDDDGTDELHLQIDNNDAVGAMTFTVTIKAEVYETGIGGGGGDVVGPASAVDGRVAEFDGTTGKLVKDGGKLVADLVTGPVSVTDSHIALFDGATGKLLKSAGVLLSSKAGVAVGTYAAELRFGGANVGMTVVLNTIRYTRIHDLVFLSGRFQISAKGSSTGNAQMTLPFAAHADGSNGGIIIGGAFGMAGLTSPPTSLTQGGATITEFLDWGATGHAALNESNFTDTFNAWISGWYRAGTSV